MPAIPALWKVEAEGWQVWAEPLQTCNLVSKLQGDQTKSDQTKRVKMAG